MSRGVAVAADQHHAGLADALLRPDDMDDALARIVEAEDGNAMRRGVAADRLDHLAAVRLVDRGDVAAGRRHVMVGRAEGAVWPRDRQVALAEHLEGAP